MVKTTPFDAAEFLDSSEAIAEYLNEAFSDGDAAFVARAIGTAARARGMADVARQAGLSRENLYRSLNGETRPEFDTVLRVLDALGLKLEAKPKVAANKSLINHRLESSTADPCAPNFKQKGPATRAALDGSLLPGLLTADTKD